MTTPNSSVGTPKTPPKIDTYFNTQTATVQGKISLVSGSTISIINDHNQTEQFSASPKIVVYKFTPGSTQSKAYPDIKALETGKEATFTLDLTNGSYQVVSVTYLGAPPPPPAK